MVMMMGMVIDGDGDGNGNKNKRDLGWRSNERSGVEIMKVGCVLVPQTQCWDVSMRIRMID